MCVCGCVCVCVCVCGVCVCVADLERGVGDLGGCRAHCGVGGDHVIQEPGHLNRTRPSKPNLSI